MPEPDDSADTELLVAAFAKAGRHRAQIFRRRIQEVGQRPRRPRHRSRHRDRQFPEDAPFDGASRLWLAVGGNRGRRQPPYARARVRRRSHRRHARLSCGSAPISPSWRRWSRASRRSRDLQPDHRRDVSGDRRRARENGADESGQQAEDGSRTAPRSPTKHVMAPARWADRALAAACPRTARPIAYRMALVASKADSTRMIRWLRNDWDVAAGDLIVREAGGRVTETPRALLLTYNRGSTDRTWRRLRRPPSPARRFIQPARLPPARHDGPPPLPLKG